MSFHFIAMLQRTLRDHNKPESANVCLLLFVREEGTTSLKPGPMRTLFHTINTKAHTHRGAFCTRACMCGLSTCLFRLWNHSALVACESLPARH
jgi:hypothetical protein